MALDNKKDAYGRAAQGALSGAGDILRQAFPGTAATLRGSGEDIGASKSIAEAAGATVRGAATLPFAIADDVFGGADRATDRLTSSFVSGLLGPSDSPSTPSRPAQPAARLLNLPTSTGGAPSFPGAVSAGRRNADVRDARSTLSQQPQQQAFTEIDAAGRDNRLGTLSAAQYEDLATKQRAHNEYMFNRSAEILDGRAPKQGGRLSVIEDPRNPVSLAERKLRVSTANNQNDNASRERIAQIGAETERERLTAAQQAGTIDAAALQRAGGAPSALQALLAAGGSNKATAEALLTALASDQQGAPQRRLDSLAQQLLTGNLPPERQQQLRSTILALQGKDQPSRFVLADQSSADPLTGAVLRNQVPFDTQTGQILKPTQQQQLPQGETPEAMLQEARTAIARGADPEKVNERLRQYGLAGVGG